jgi:hypothetical protein
MGETYKANAVPPVALVTGAGFVRDGNPVAL